MTDTKIVPVKASGCYDITIGNSILPKVGEILKDVKKACKAVIVTDSNVDKLYSETVKESLEKAGFSAEKYRRLVLTCAKVDIFLNLQNLMHCFFFSFQKNRQNSAQSSSLHSFATICNS